MSIADDAAPPVVLVHGWGGSFEGTWGKNGWREALAQHGRTLIEIDLPGHGRPDGSRDPADYADLAASVLATLPPGPLDVMGFSLGAKVTMAMASLDPARFRRIVITGVGDKAFESEISGVLAGWLEGGFLPEHRAQMPAISAYLDRSDNDLNAIAAVLRRPYNPVIDEARLARITGQVLVINGDVDTVAIPDTRLRAALGDPEYVSLPGLGHFVIPEDPGYQRAAIEFLTRT